MIHSLAPFLPFCVNWSRSGKHAAKTFSFTCMRLLNIEGNESVFWCNRSAVGLTKICARTECSFRSLGRMEHNADIKPSRQLLSTDPEQYVARSLSHHCMLYLFPPIFESWAGSVTRHLSSYRGLRFWRLISPRMRRTWSDLIIQRNFKLCVPTRPHL